MGLVQSMQSCSVYKTEDADLIGEPQLRPWHHKGVQNADHVIHVCRQHRVKLPLYATVLARLSHAGMHCINQLTGTVTGLA